MPTKGRCTKIENFFRGLAAIVRCARFFVLCCLLIFVQSMPAFAVQSHGGSEGLVAHQIGHLLFVSGLGYLLFRIYRMALQGAGWPSFRLFLWLLLSWNLLTFSGHWLDEVVSRQQFLFEGGAVRSFRVEGLLDAVYYLSRLDHLLLVPAAIFLLLSLRKWSAET